MSRQAGFIPDDTRALVAVDLGAESCRVSLLRWLGEVPHIELVHRFPNGPVAADDGSLRWLLETIIRGTEQGLRMCAELAPEGIRSIAVDGWAVDYVRLDQHRQPLDAPFCYRDPRTGEAQARLHQRIAAERLRELTGVQMQPLNTLYQLYADRLADADPGSVWLNLPEYLLCRWGAAPVAEYTNATHTQMVELGTRTWSREILEAAGLAFTCMPEIVPPGTCVGQLAGHLAELPAFRQTQLIAPACHDTASAIAGIPAQGDDWGYISAGTWSLVGTPLARACNSSQAREEQFTNLGGVGDRILFQKNVNGLWLLKQCMDQWAAAGDAWEIGALVSAAEQAQPPEWLLDIEDPELLKIGDMPARINRQRADHGLSPMDESSRGAPVMASLIFHSLAATYAALLARMEHLSGKPIGRVFLVGGGSRNDFLRRLTAEAAGKPVFAGSPESSTLGNFAVQMAVLEPGAEANPFRERVGNFAALLCSPRGEAFTSS